MFEPASYVLDELRARTAELEHEVHALASRYGWAESEILALPSAAAAALPRADRGGRRAMTGLLGRIALRGAGLPAGPAASTPLRPPVGAEGEGGEPDEIVEEVVAASPRAASPPPVGKPPPAAGERVSAPSPPPPEPGPVAPTAPAEPAPVATKPPPRAARAMPASEAPTRVFRAPLERPPDAARRSGLAAGRVPKSGLGDQPDRRHRAHACTSACHPQRRSPRFPRRRAPPRRRSPQARQIVRRTVVERVEAPRVLHVPVASERHEDAGRPEPTQAVSPEIPVEPPAEVEEPPPQPEPPERPETADARRAPEPTAAEPEVEVTIGTIEVQLAPEPSRGGEPGAGRGPSRKGSSAYAGIR